MTSGFDEIWCVIVVEFLLYRLRTCAGLQTDWYNISATLGLRWQILVVLWSTKKPKCMRLEATLISCTVSFFTSLYPSFLHSNKAAKPWKCHKMKQGKESSLIYKGFIQERRELLSNNLNRCNFCVCTVHTRARTHTNTTHRCEPKLAVNKLAHLFSISGSWIKDLVAEEEQKTHLQRGKMENRGEGEDEYLCVCVYVCECVCE